MILTIAIHFLQWLRGLLCQQIILLVHFNWCGIISQHLLGCCVFPYFLHLLNTNYYRAVAFFIIVENTYFDKIKE